MSGENFRVLPLDMTTLLKFYKVKAKFKAKKTVRHTNQFKFGMDSHSARKWFNLHSLYYSVDWFFNKLNKHVNPLEKCETVFYLNIMGMLTVGNQKILCFQSMKFIKINLDKMLLNKQAMSEMN